MKKALDSSFHLVRTGSNNIMMLAVCVPQMKENCVKMSGLCLHKASKENPTGYYKQQPSVGGEGLFRSLPCVSSDQRSPLPTLRWAASGEVWDQMRQQDVVKSAPEAELQVRHPGIVPNMRVILLDWMLEVRVCVGY